MTNVPSVLGETRVRIPIAGRIRSGIKVLTRKAEENPLARKIYDEGVRMRESFEEISKKISEKAGIKDALVPKNTEYFVVHRHDFVVPETADRILELYGEDRGDGMRRLYRFPVVFAMDSWQAVIPHAFRCFSASELKYWSEYSPDGKRFCMTHGAVPVDPKAKRAKRLFGGRPVVIRKENGGICNPDDCPEYQAKQCNLSGEFLFYMPGIPGAGMISLPTTSPYAMVFARGTLEMVAAMRGGRIAGLIDGKPIFWIGKRLRKIPMLDRETGLRKKVSQWVIELESSIEAVSLMRPGDPDEAESLLNGERRPPMPDPAKPAQLQHAGSSLADSPATNSGQEQAAEPEPQQAQEPVPAEEIAAGAAEVYKAILNKRKLVHDMIKEAGLDMDEFVAYANAAYGHGWGKDLQKLQNVIEELDPITDNPATAQEWRKKARALISEKAA